MATSPPQQQQQPPPPPPPPPLNLFSVLSESKRIINAHSRHFLALSVLFLLPISFSFTALPTLLHPLLLSPHPNPSVISLLLPSSSEDDSVFSPLALSVSYAAFLLLFSLLAAASVSSSVFRGFYGRPVRLLSAARSVAAAFLPLLATSLAVALVAAAIASAFALLLFLAVVSAKLLGFRTDYSSPCFLAPLGALLAALAAILTFLQVNWCLVPAIVVAESTWGLAALRRSAGLIRGMRGTAASLSVLLGISAAVLVWSAVSLSGGGGLEEAWRTLGLVVQIVVTSTFLTVALLYKVAADTVLYMYCKAVHGELAMEIAQEFATEYVCLPFDDHKLPHVVSVSSA